MEDREILYGRQVVLECLRAARRPVRRLLLARGMKGAREEAEARRLAAARGATVSEADRREIDRLAQGGHHQGWALEAGPFPYAEMEEVLAHAAAADEPPFLLALDHVEDPQNVGSMLRTAEAAGVHGVILPRDRAAGVTPAVVRASSGAAEHLRVAQVVNLVRALEQAKAAGIWVYGLEAVPEAPLYTEARLDGAVALVVGSEGQGLQRLVRDRCDGLVRLPMRGHVASLNAAVSAAIALYRIRALRDRSG